MSRLRLTQAFDRHVLGNRGEKFLRRDLKRFESIRSSFREMKTCKQQNKEISSVVSQKIKKQSHALENQTRRTRVLAAPATRSSIEGQRDCFLAVLSVSFQGTKCPAARNQRVYRGGKWRGWNARR